jgi:hypothetical protein
VDSRASSKNDERDLGHSRNQKNESKENRKDEKERNKDDKKESLKRGRDQTKETRKKEDKKEGQNEDIKEEKQIRTKNIPEGPKAEVDNGSVNTSATFKAENNADLGANQDSKVPSEAPKLPTLPGLTTDVRK